MDKDDIDLNFIMKGVADSHVVVIRRGGFEHLLNCLVNQKRKLSPGEQKIIDNCWKKGMELLNDKSLKCVNGSSCPICKLWK